MRIFEMKYKIQFKNIFKIKCNLTRKAYNISRHKFLRFKENENFQKMKNKTKEN